MIYIHSSNKNTSSIDKDIFVSNISKTRYDFGPKTAHFTFFKAYLLCFAGRSHLSCPARGGAKSRSVFSVQIERHISPRRAVGKSVRKHGRATSQPRFYPYSPSWPGARRRGATVPLCGRPYFYIDLGCHFSSNLNLN